MALSYWEASLAAAARVAGIPFQRVLMLGRQTSLLSVDVVDHVNRAYGTRLQSGLATEKWAEPFFQQLGAGEVSSLDYSDYEGAQYTHDMNQPWPNGTPPGQFDVVFDGGTLEHVFNLSQGLLNAMSLVRVGGHYLGASPGDGWLGHGFHQLQPELFFRFFTSERGFVIKGVWLAEFGREPESSHLFKLKDPAECGCRNLVPGRRPLTILVCAEKTTEVAVPPVWPGQSNYTAMWQGSSETSEMAKRSAIGSLKHLAFGLLPKTLRSTIKARLIAKKHERLALKSWEEATIVQLDRLA
ncbi:MAG: hypothetical protein JNJ83_19395 [Verrucomicrobiaceae bacterium]|nr:hypothetical protein [Verrucomicrobiaceae bacterium]